MRSVILYCPSLERNIDGLLTTMPGATVYIGRRTPHGEDGCLEAHKDIVGEATRRGEPSVCVVEDDCVFAQQFDLVKWQQDADWAQAHGYDVMSGGSTRTYDQRHVRDGMIEVSAFHSSHCLVYFESGYDKIQHAVTPLDWSLGRDCGMRCVVVWPFVAVQRPAFSGIEQRHVDYVPLYARHEAELGRL